MKRNPHVHNTALARMRRKEWITEKARRAAGVDLRQLKIWIRREFGLTNRKIDEYLAELEEEAKLKVVDGRIHPILEIDEEETWILERARSMAGAELRKLKTRIGDELALTEESIDRLLALLEEEGKIRIMAGRVFPVLIKEEVAEAKAEVVQSKWPAPRANSAGED